MSSHVPSYRRNRHFDDAYRYHATIRRLERQVPLAGTAAHRHLVAARKAYDRSVRLCASQTGCDSYIIDRDASRQYGLSSFKGNGAYKRASKRAPRGRGRGGKRRRVGFERVLGEPGGREYLSSAYWAHHPNGKRPWWATRNPREMVVEELAAVQQHNPATAHAIGQAIGAAFGAGLVAPSFGSTGLPTPLRVRPREPLGPEELDPDPALNSSRRLF